MAKFSVRLVPIRSLGCRKPLRGLDDANKVGLMHSIGERGLLQPIVVRQEGDRFEVLDGVHRWQACLSLGWEEIPAVVVEDISDEVEGLLSATEMNLVGRDMSPVDKARCIQQWIGLAELRQVDIAMRLGVSETKVCTLLSLLKLPKALQELAHSGLLAETTAYDLVRRHTTEELEAMAGELMSGGLTNKQVVAKLSVRSKRKSSPRRSHSPWEYGMHFSLGRCLAMQVPHCACIGDLATCLRDALAELEARQARGATLESFSLRRRSGEETPRDGDGADNAA